MTRLERYSTSAINATNGGALTMATKEKRVQDAEKESSKNVRRFPTEVDNLHRRSKLQYNTHFDTGSQMKSWPGQG